MPQPTIGSSIPRVLPARPNLEFLRNEAKDRLAVLRAVRPGARLAEAQFQLAREYGFASWRALKADVDGRPPAIDPAIDPVGAWIGRVASGAGAPFGLHIVRTEGGALRASLDVPEVGRFGDPVAQMMLEGDRLSFVVLIPERSINSLCRLEWDADAQQWAGEWIASGFSVAVTFTRGRLPPASAVAGLDGIWDGRLETSTGPVRLIFRISTGANGTTGFCDSPDRSGEGFPIRAIRREDDAVTLTLKTLAVSGRLDETGERIDGRYRRGETDLPLTLVRRAPGAAPPRPPSLPAIDLTSEQLALYVGEYAFAGGSQASVTLDGGTLHIVSAGQPRLALQATSPTAFVLVDLDASLVFTLGADGAVTGFVSRSHGREARAVRLA